MQPMNQILIQSSFFLSKTLLFKGIESQDILKMLNCLKAFVREFEKEQIILHMGDTTQNMGLVLEGSVNIESYDFYGKKIILSHVNKGQLFAETYACISNEPLMVNAVAAEKCRVLFINASKMLSSFSDSYTFDARFIKNLLEISALKNLNLSRRILHSAPKTIRERIESYFAYESRKKNTKSFTIPFDRYQLAEYLNVDRSALSHELGKMRKEGILDFKKNKFVLK